MVDILAPGGVRGECCYHRHTSRGDKCCCGSTTIRRAVPELSLLYASQIPLLRSNGGRFWRLAPRFWLTVGCRLGGAE